MSSRFRWVLALAVGSSLVLAACGGGGGSGDAGSGNGDAGQSVDDGTGGDSSTLKITAPVNAANSGFAETSLSAPADTALTIDFVNDDDGIPHNVQIFEGTGTTGTPLWAPADNALITGPDEARYEVPALPAGTYTFNCLAHPTTMVGTIEVG